MAFDADLISLLPLNQHEFLQQAIGRVLEDTVRLFHVDLPTFLKYNPERCEVDYYGLNSGPTTFLFTGGLAHTFGVWGEALSLVVTREPIVLPQDGDLVRLSSMNPPSPLKELKGQTCTDVRVWLFMDSHDDREPKQAGVSYLFRSEREILYSIYLHGDLDNDVLLLDPFPLDRVAACISIRDGQDILPSLIANSMRNPV